MFRGVIAQMNIAGTPEIPKAPQTAASQATKAAMAEAEALVAYLLELRETRESLPGAQSAGVVVAPAPEVKLSNCASVML